MNENLSFVDECPIKGQSFKQCACSQTCKHIKLELPAVCPPVCQPGCTCPSGQVSNCHQG